jgi:hypothetical protein
MKVFGIGLNKTGTTTLGLCLKHFGYRHTSSDVTLARHVGRGELEPVFAHADRYDSFEDWPWPLIYRELDTRYPGSKFVLTTRRDAETWLKSLKNHALLTGPTEFREIAYGYPMPHGREAEHIERYERHNREVREYFAGRPEDLLELCWETGSGWKELCGFLGQEVPDLPVPHSNRSVDKRGRLLWRGATRLVSRVLRRGVA